ncbi:putative 10 kda secreted protein [Cucumis melo var. makuwa]|uniref:10 kDa secreted protein n=1 Tax=Cucumis melo var. makuwa TaxID=1194695 RepID=A0A5A7VIL0_CUCMM|nr:putative 10 kda secreted protein [Cucumis melo var. makuwa]
MPGQDEVRGNPDGGEAARLTNQSAKWANFAGRWPWKSESAKECVTTHLPKQLALKMDGAEASCLYSAVRAREAGLVRHEALTSRRVASVCAEGSGREPAWSRRRGADRRRAKGNPVPIPEPSIGTVPIGPLKLVRGAAREEHRTCGDVGSVLSDLENPGEGHVDIRSGSYPYPQQVSKVSRACQRSGRFLCRMPGLGEVEPQGEINPGPSASAYPVDLSSFRGPWITAAGQLAVPRVSYGHHLKNNLELALTRGIRLALNVNVKKFKQARVNGGSNYDSLKHKWEVLAPTLKYHYFHRCCTYSVGRGAPPSGFKTLGTAVVLAPSVEIGVRVAVSPWESENLSGS